MNPAGREFMGVNDLDSVPGLDWLSVWQGEDRKLAERALEQVRGGHAARFTGQCRTFRSETRSRDVVVSPMRDQAGKYDSVAAGSDFARCDSDEARRVARADRA